MLLFLIWPLLSFSSSYDYTMTIGEQMLVRRPLSSPLTISNPKAAKIIPVKGGLHVIGKSVGVTTVMSRQSGKVSIAIISPKVAALRRDIDSRLEHIHGIGSQVVNNQIVLSGTAYRLSDWKKVVQWVKENPKIVISAVEPLSEEWGVGQAKSQILELKPMIEISIVIAEMKKHSGRQLGLNPPQSYSATIIPSAHLRSFETQYNSLNVSIDAGFTKAEGRVLANPKLLCRSGDTAHFIAGGEIPIKIISFKTSEIQWKKYGVILDITPIADAHDRLSTKILTEVSLLDQANKVDGIPGLLTNRIETHFNLQGPNTIALSGLIKSETVRNQKGLSGLGEIPILGELFKSRSYLDDRTELIVFVTPRVISVDQVTSTLPLGLDWENLQ